MGVVVAADGIPAGNQQTIEFHRRRDRAGRDDVIAVFIIVIKALIIEFDVAGEDGDGAGGDARPFIFVLFIAFESAAKRNTVGKEKSRSREIPNANPV